MRSSNPENAEERHDQQKSCIDDGRHSKSKWYPPKLKRINIDATLNNTGGGVDGGTPTVS